jgi:hypothetical protein
LSYQQYCRPPQTNCAFSTGNNCEATCEAAMPSPIAASAVLAIGNANAADNAKPTTRFRSMFHVLPLRCRPVLESDVPMGESNCGKLAAFLEFAKIAKGPGI